MGKRIALTTAGVTMTMKNLFGMKAMGDAHDHLLLRFWLSMTEGGGPHLATTAIGVATIALVLALRWLKRRLAIPMLPDLLITICVISALVAWLEDQASQAAREARSLELKAGWASFPQGDGRPTKKSRRQLNRFRQQDGA